MDHSGRSLCICLNVLLSLCTLGFEVNHPSHTNRCSLAFFHFFRKEKVDQYFDPAKSHIIKVLFFEAPGALFESLMRTVRAQGMASHWW